MRHPIILIITLILACTLPSSSWAQSGRNGSYQGGSYVPISKRQNQPSFPNERKTTSGARTTSDKNRQDAPLKEKTKEINGNKGVKEKSELPSPDPELTLTTEEKFVRRFEMSQRLAFDEKLYIHTDKDFYSAADTIFLKGYLCEPEAFTPGRSAFIYVELIDEHQEVMARYKFKGENGGFAGHLPLNANLPAGTYQMRAYSWWMLKYDEAFFFKKEIRIGNDLGLQISSHSTFRTLPQGDMEATVRVIDRHKKPITNQRIKVTKRLLKKTKTEYTQTNSQGEITILLPPEMQKNDSASFHILTINSPYQYAKKFNIPTSIDNIDMQFFPESGHLVPEEPQIVAFKALNKEGLSVDVKGLVVNNKGDTIANIITSHNGMGRFLLYPIEGETYKAIITTHSSTAYTFALPRAMPAVTIRCTFRKGRIVSSIFNKTALSSDSLFLIIHSKGKFLYCQSISKLTDGHLIIDHQKLPSGIVNLMVVNSQGDALAERLVFIPVADNLHATLTTDKPSYGKRERVKALFAVADSSGTTIGGNFSVAVTNSRLVPSNTFADNIRSYLHLSSDIKGHIENPTQYFNISDPLRIEKLDILLLTQGWRRYDLTTIFQQKNSKEKPFLELGQSIAGKIKNFSGQAKSKANVFLFSPQKGHFYTTTTKSNGEFLFDGITFEDSTQFIIKTHNPKALANLLSVEVEKQNYPNPLPLTSQHDWVDENTAREYLFSVKEKIFTSDGMRLIELQEVEIVAHKTKENSISNSMMAFASNNYTDEQLKAHESLTVHQFLSTLPKIGLLLNQEYKEEKIVDTFEKEDESTLVFTQIDMSQSGPVIFIVNEQPAEYDLVRGTLISAIKSLAVITDAANTAIYNSSGKPVVIIQLKTGEQLAGGELHSSMCLTMPLGYTKAAEFYQPRYEVNAQQLKHIPDHRTTIFWEPNLLIDKKSGQSPFQFYTADRKDPYRIVIEGITSNGIPLHYESTILKNNNTP